jgi:hypothetical protein
MSRARGFTAEQHAQACAIGFAKWHERYAGPPGSGPEGATCRTCAHKTYSDLHNRPPKHPKCGLVPFTSGDATTIRTGTPACLRYLACDETRGAA